MLTVNATPAALTSSTRRATRVRSDSRYGASPHRAKRTGSAAGAGAGVGAGAVEAGPAAGPGPPPAHAASRPHRARPARAARDRASTASRRRPYATRRSGTTVT